MGSNGVTQRCVSPCVNLEPNLEPFACPRGFGARRPSHRCEMRNGKIMLCLLCKASETLKNQQKTIQTIRFLSSVFLFFCIRAFSRFVKNNNMVGIFCITFSCIEAEPPPAGNKPTWNPTWNLNGHPLDLVGKKFILAHCGMFAEAKPLPPETNQPGTQLGT